MGDIVLVPALTALSYLFCEAMKATPIPNKFLPLIGTLFGALAGGLLFFLAPELLGGVPDIGRALLSGGGSGCLATGAYETVMQFVKPKKNQ